MYILNMTGIPRLVFRLVLDPRVPLRTKLILPAAIAYLILPFDFFPDFIVPRLGHVDDVLVLLISVVLFLILAPKEVVYEHLRSGRPGGKKPGDDPADPPVIEGSYKILDEDEKPQR